MTLMRTLSRVGKNGELKIPGNIQRAAEIKEGGLVELKIIGASRKKNVLITPRGIAR